MRQERADRRKDGKKKIKKKITLTFSKVIQIAQAIPFAQLIRNGLDPINSSFKKEKLQNRKWGKENLMSRRKLQIRFCEVEFTRLTSFIEKTPISYCHRAGA